jgi:hypothetical protein
MLTEFQRMQIIGEEFPIALVDPLVIQKVDSVARAIEQAAVAADRALRKIDNEGEKTISGSGPVVNLNRPWEAP